MIEHSSPISGISVSQERYVATAGYDSKIILWDVFDKKPLACGFHDHLVNQCTFSPCGNFLVSTSSDASARLWSVPDMRLLFVFSDHDDDVEGVAIHPNQQLVATGSRDSFIRVFDFKGQLIHRFEGHVAPVLSVAWVNQDELVSSSDDGTIRRWSFKERICLGVLDLDNVQIDTVSVSSQGDIFSGTDHGEIIILKNTKKNVIQAHDSGIKHLNYNDNNQLLVSLSYDKSFKIWNVSKSDEPRCILHESYPATVWARSCDFLGKDNLVFASFSCSYIHYNLKTRTWDEQGCRATYGINTVLINCSQCYTAGDSGIILRNGEFFAAFKDLFNFIVSVDDRLLCGGQNGTLYDAYSRNKIYQHKLPLNCAISLTYNSRSYVVVGDYHGDIIIFSVDRSKISFVNKVAVHHNPIKSLAIGKNMIYAVSADGASCFLDLDDFSIIKKINGLHEDIANDCVYFKDGYFASVGRDLKLRFASLTDCYDVATKHQYSIKCIALSTKKEFIATGDYRGQVHVYKVNEQQWLTAFVSVSGISCLIYDDRESSFLASCYDGCVYRIKVSLSLEVTCSQQGGYYDSKS